MSDQAKNDLLVAIQKNAKAAQDTTADEALKYTQAALNAANALATTKANT